MTDYSVAEAKNRLPDLINRAARGETVVITRRGKPVATVQPIVPVRPPVSPEVRRALYEERDRLLAAQTFCGEPSVDLIRRMRDDEDFG